MGFLFSPISATTCDSHLVFNLALTVKHTVKTNNNEYNSYKEDVWMQQKSTISFKEISKYMYWSFLQSKDGTRYKYVKGYWYEFLLAFESHNDSIVYFEFR